jgi:hypothetical protein
LADVRHFREQERLRFWPGVWRRWALAVVFALVAAAAAGAGYAWRTECSAAEPIALRERAELGDALAARMSTMTPAERLQLELLIVQQPSTKP